jgi:hypothetical protein
MRTTILALFVLAAAAQPCDAVIVYATSGSTYSQNFDSLATSGATNAWANDTTITGWHLFRQPSPGTAITTYIANDGGNNAGSFYSFGTGTNAERALGGTGSGGAYFGNPATGAVAGWIAMSVQNATGATIDSFTLTFDGEQWRNGGNASAQPMVLEYGFGGTFDAVSSWTAPGGSFDWTSPVNSTTAAAVDGNAAGLVANRGGAISNLTWQNSQTLWVRWVERNDTGNDHGLAIDSVSFQAVAIPEPGAFPFGGLICGVIAIGAAWRRFFAA